MVDPAADHGGLARAARLPTPGRLAAVDIIRGFCILSMVSSHLTVGSLLSRALHPFPAFDGAPGFVLLSGLVLGIVQHKRFAAHGLAAVEWKTVRRIGVIVVAQLSLVLLGLVVGLAAPHDGVPPVREYSITDLVWG